MKSSISKEKKRRRKIENKIALVRHLGWRCKKCGYHKSLSALHFHHRNPKKKAFKLADRRSLSFDKLLKEAKKCDLLCANCHAEEHESQEARDMHADFIMKHILR